MVIPQPMCLLGCGNSHILDVMSNMRVWDVYWAKTGCRIDSLDEPLNEQNYCAKKIFQLSLKWKEIFFCGFELNFIINQVVESIAGYKNPRYLCNYLRAARAVSSYIQFCTSFSSLHRLSSVVAFWHLILFSHRLSWNFVGSLLEISTTKCTLSLEANLYAIKGLLLVFYFSFLLIFFPLYFTDKELSTFLYSKDVKN